MLFVLTLVGGGLALTAGDLSENEESAPSTIERDIDPARCQATIDEMTAFLDESFAAQSSEVAESGGTAATDDDIAAQAVWDEFFIDVAATCSDIGAAISEIIVFSSTRADELQDDPGAQLVALLTTAQLCTIDVVQLTSPAVAVCQTAADDATAGLNDVFGDTLETDSPPEG